MKPSDVLALVQARKPADVALVMGIIEHESSFNERAFKMDRNGGSIGLGQLDLPTARDRGYTGEAAGLYDPPTNVELVIAQLAWIKSYLAQRSALGLGAMIAAYNEGVGNVIRGNPDPLYVASVTSARARWQQALGTGVG